jgi:hypothetical protein
MRLIGFGGPAEHGKSTCASLAEEILTSQGYKVKVISFADRLKAACKVIFRLTDHDLIHPIGKTTIKSHLSTTPREVLQKFGTEVCREILPQYLMTDILREAGGIWTWNVEQDILETDADEDTVILIPDVRFPNELAMLRKHGATFINVMRPRHLNLNLNHVSEAGLTGADYTIINDGDLTDLKINVISNLTLIL